MGKVPGGIAVELYTFDTKAFKQPRHNNSPDGIDGIHDHGESRRLYGWDIHGLKGEHSVQMAVCEVFFGDCSELVDFGEIKVFLLCKVKYCLPLRCGEKFSLVVQKFKGVPLAGVVRRRKYDTSVGLREQHCHFSSGGGCKTAFYHIYTASDKGSDHQLFHHVSRQTGVFSDDYLVFRSVRAGFSYGESGGIGRGEFDDINRSQSSARLPADGSADTGNGFYKCHRQVLG